MTNDHPDSDPMHEEGADHENAPHEAGVWTDDRPPHDDFTDASAASEEMASATQELTAEADETAISTAGRSRSRLPVIIGILCVMILGGVGYWKFGQLSAGTSTVAQTDTQKPVPENEPVSQTPKVSAIQPPAPAPTGAQSDINALKAPTDLPSSAPLMPNSASVNAASPIPMVPVVPPTANNPPSPVSVPAPYVQAKAVPTLPPPAVAPQNSPSASAAPAPPSTPATIPFANSGQTQTRIDALTARIDGLEKSLDDATKQMAQMNDHIAAAQTAPNANAVSPAIDDRLDKIEQNLQNLQHNASAKSAAASKVPAKNAVPAIKKASAAAVATAKHKPVHKKTASVHAKAKAQSAETEVPVSSAWMLRAATPTEAWISVNATSPELHHVQLGDQLPGIGSVKAIHQTPGGWEVLGSEGAVH